MNGPSEFTVTGTLKTWDIMDRLGEITVPALLVGGRYDECTPGHMAEMHQRIAGSQLATIEDASHLCFAEQPETFNALVNKFLAERSLAGTSQARRASCTQGNVGLTALLHWMHVDSRQRNNSG